VTGDLPGRKPASHPLDPDLIARARRVLKAREERDRWARWDMEQEEARDEARRVWNGGNR